ncbi:MAG: hypothetical protein IT379_22820 [Deltaproteobacteria bacterium]|nr:hypothetical protein [Deltaproteobacteria bacterium]
MALVENLDSREQADFIAGELRRFLARPGPEKVRVPPPPDATANAPSPAPEPDEVEAEAGPDARSSARGHHP